MGSEKTSVRVIPVTHARPWLEEKLRNLELKLAGVQDFGEVSHEEGFRERILVLAKHRDEYTSQLQMLYQEFGELFRDYAGYENPPVLEEHPVFEKIKKTAWIPATEDQYLLGSLDLEGEGNSRIRDWCNQLDLLEKNVIGMNDVIHEFYQERNQRNQGIEMDQLELVLEQQKVLIQESLKLQQENQKQIKRDQRLLMQQKKTLASKQVNLKKKEEELQSNRQKLAEDQALLMAREESLQLGQTQLEQNQGLLIDAAELIRSQAQLMSEEVSRLEKFNQETNQEAPDEAELLQTKTKQDLGVLLSNHQDLHRQQKELLEGIENAGDRLDQDKNWIKSLLKGLLDQQEKFQHTEDQMREREKESIIRKETDLQNERGWIKVEKAKLQQSEIQKEEHETTVSDPLF